MSRSWRRAIFALAAALPLGSPTWPALAAPAAHDGPFGLYFGEPLSALGPVRSDGHGAHLLRSVPRPSVDLPSVVAFTLPGKGVCGMGGVSQGFSDDRSGKQARQLADRLQYLFARKYGPPSAPYSDCDGDEQQCGDDWAATASAGKADYGDDWDLAGAQRSDGVQSISLFINAENSSVTKVVVVLLGPDKDACDQVVRTASMASLVP